MRRKCACILVFTSVLAIGVNPLRAQTSVDKAWSVLQSGLAKKGENKVIALRVLGLLEGNPKAVEIATAALDDGNPGVRTAAADVLGELHARSATPKLKAMIESDKDPAVVIAAARALIAFDDPLGYAVYYAVLTGERKASGGLLDDQRKMLSDPKKMATVGIEQGVGFIPFASLGLGAFKALTKDDNSPVRAAAARVLAKDSDPKSGEALIAASADKSWIVRAAALDALARRGDPSVIPKIESALDDDKDDVRYAAAATIIHLYDVQTGGASHKQE
ncbi:MAG: HEAT repeat domain-containing protein [Terracidiphilus sp.]